MKYKDVKLGERYWTKVGDDLVEVVPYAETTTGPSPDRQRAAFRVKRADNGKELPKPRTPAALRLRKI